MLDRHADAVAGMFDEDPKAPATAIRERLQPLGHTGGITIFKEHLAEMRPNSVAARSYQRTTYLPGELSQLDCAVQRCLSSARTSSGWRPGAIDSLRSR